MSWREYQMGLQELDRRRWAQGGAARRSDARLILCVLLVGIAVVVGWMVMQ
jgi:hypothetical protein